MLRFKLDAGDFQFLAGATTHYFDIAHEGVKLDIRIHSDAMSEVYLQKGEQLLLLGYGMVHEYQVQCTGFDSVVLKATAKTKHAVSLTQVRRMHGELLDPTPVAVTLSTSKQMNLSQMVRMEIRKILEAQGEDPDDADLLDLDPLDGDFEDDDEDVLDTDYMEADEGPESDQEEADDKPPAQEEDQPPVVETDGSDDKT